MAILWHLCKSPNTQSLCHIVWKISQSCHPNLKQEFNSCKCILSTHTTYGKQGDAGLWKLKNARDVLGLHPITPQFYPRSKTPCFPFMGQTEDKKIVLYSMILCDTVSCHLIISLYTTGFGVWSYYIISFLIFECIMSIRQYYLIALYYTRNRDVPYHIYRISYHILSCQIKSHSFTLL